MHFWNLLLSSILFCFTVLPSFLAAQNLSPEFIESSSPLPNGGRVISRATPGNGVQTVTTESSVSARTINNRSAVTEQAVNSVLEGNTNGSTGSGDSDNQVNRESMFRQPTPTSASSNTTQGQQSVSQRYPYPANRVAAYPGYGGYASNFQVARGGLIHSPVRASVGCTNCQIPYQVPTLGLSNTVRTQRAPQVFAPNQCCAPNVYNAPASLQVPAFQQPVLQLQQPVASQVPSLGTQINPGAAQSVPIGTAPTLGTPTFQTQSNRWWSPFISGSGVYQPIVRLANLQPGTYLGQGIIGQPTAYVDGQPVRNLMRYIFP